MGLFAKLKKKKASRYEEEKWLAENYAKVYEPLEEKENTVIDSDMPIMEEPLRLKGREEKIQFAEDCCEQILEASKRAAETKKEYKAVNSYLEDIRIIKELEPKLKEDLEYNARRIINLKADKESYRNYGTKIPETKYNYIEANEKKMPNILKELHDDENYMQSLKTDLHNIEGERAGLNYEKKMYADREKLLKKVIMTVIFIELLVLCVMSYFQLNSEYDLTIGILLSVAIAVGIAAVVMVLHQNNVREIKLTERKINKAIGLMNKYKLLYANMKSRIDYAYKSMGIRNSYELSNYWRLYITAKKEQQVYSKMSDELYQTQTNFNNIISSLNLFDEFVWSYQLDAIVNEKAMEEINTNLNKRKKGLRKSLDYNTKRVEKCKNDVKKLIKEEPMLASEIMEIVEKYL